MIVDLSINETLPIGEVGNLAYPDKSGSKPTGPDNKFTPIYRGIETEGRKCLSVFRIHHELDRA